MIGARQQEIWSIKPSEHEVLSNTLGVRITDFTPPSFPRREEVLRGGSLVGKQPYTM